MVILFDVYTYKIEQSEFKIIPYIFQYVTIALFF